MGPLDRDYYGRQGLRSVRGQGLLRETGIAFCKGYRDCVL